MNRIYAIAAVALVALGGYFAWSGSQTQTPGASFGAVSAQEAADIDTSGVLEMTMGNPDAPVTVIEYASFTCPHCRDFHAGSFKQLKSDYIDTNKINFVYREVYFDRYGLWAGMVARCGGPERYFGFTDLLYSTQSEWARAGDPPDVAQALKRLGRQGGLSEEQVTACLSDGDKAQAMVALYQKNAAADGVNSTPSFIINGTLHSNMPYSEFSSLIDAELAN